MPSRAPKRTKIEERNGESIVSSSQTADRDDKHVVFTKWARNQGVEINGVAPSKLEGRGLGLMTTRKIKSGERMLSIPEKAMFKPDSKLLKQRRLERASPQAQLAYSAMSACKAKETGLGVWQATWPEAQDFWQSMPMCWSEDMRGKLPPSVQQPLERQLADYRKDWTALADVCRKYDYSEDDFKYFWMIVNSRSFHWKPPKGRPGSMVMCPFIDYMNHGPTGTTCQVTTDQHGYEVHADRDYEAGEEVLATYGAHSNDKLLVHYGFVIDSPYGVASPDDDIRLDHILLPKLEERVKAQLQDVGFLGAYALLPQSNELCFKTQVAVRAQLLTANEWEYFMTNGEDMSSDQSGAVKAFMVPLMRTYYDECVVRIGSLGGESTAADLMKTRWTQIQRAVDAYINE
ncbi:hypothetical protein D0869_16038 [Hortaea werneckii]|uniref:SET domain-containing protein n=1 Tax=Hortaea werneckii TaxID=91943 RepID=A0A3M6VXS4_HORWE|nr:SET domain-containing protein [Hortaea werneckii]KAI7143769.1 SET domain-containing protein [Hortaea werneckii]KAI7534941.1 SET domain-containing protein [Hortaea werneckii]RMX71043.1 hypothetical protein D0869_16038 [Hortaea werneckii]RMX83983.1 hypothetical protein D0868_15566 [Hortaea werneckii]